MVLLYTTTAFLFEHDEQMQQLQQQLQLRRRGDIRRNDVRYEPYVRTNNE